MSFGQRDSTVPSLYKRPRPTGAVWAVRARQRGTGKVVTVTIGKCSLVAVQEARKIARGHLFNLSQGINPNEANRTKQAAEQAAKELDAARDMSLGDAMRRYLSYGQRKPRTIQDIQATVERNFSDWLSMPARAITQGMVEDRFNEIKARAAKRRADADQRMRARGATPQQFHSPPGQGEAQRAFRYLSAILNPLLDRLIDDQPILKVNPVKALRHIKATYQLKPRERHLDANQIWQLFDDFTINNYVRKYGQQGDVPVSPVKEIDEVFVVLLLLTGARKEEILNLQTSDVDFNAGVFTLRDTKNKSDHHIPMTDAMRSLLNRRVEEAKHLSTLWLFPSPNDSQKKASMSRVFQRVTKQLGFHFTAHDLRRTFATTAKRLGTDMDTIQQALNHKKQGVTASYIQWTTESLKKTFQDVEDFMLEKWDDPEADGDDDLKDDL
ncbi:MAG: tyrosine-type recombinase/integrase [Proteobacteria bacterium]|nr:tyrosine-type recombinase/integrase [Pseudomonadota bacterium]